MQGPSIIPDDETGASSDTTYELTESDPITAITFFAVAKQRLLDVNSWHTFCGKPSAVFQLTDENGIEVPRSAQLGDHFKINIPGPGNSAGEGADWVQIEAIEHTVEENKEVLAMRVRPTKNPNNDKQNTAHFFTEEASSTFSVTRIGNKIIAAVNGRNEKPNVQENNIADTIRNAVVAAGAIIGLNKQQWKSLVKGLLEKRSRK